MKTAEDIIKSKGNALFTVSPETLILEALAIMAQEGIGGILVKKKNKIIGIWTERDLVSNSVLASFDCGSSKIEDFMTTDLKSAKHSDTIYSLMDKFLGLRIRHLLIEKKGKYIGLLTSGDVLKIVLQEKNKELKDLQALSNWDYYENWKFGDKKSKSKK